MYGSFLGLRRGIFTSKSEILGLKIRKMQKNEYLNVFIIQEYLNVFLIQRTSLLLRNQTKMYAFVTCRAQLDANNHGTSKRRLGGASFQRL